MFVGRSGPTMAEVSSEPIPLHRPVRWSRRPDPAPLAADPEVVLPVGTATLLVADLAGGDVEPAVRELAGRHGGVTPFDPPAGPAIAAFARASDALACAVSLLRADPRPRVTLHTGELDVASEGAYL